MQEIVESRGNRHLRQFASGILLAIAATGGTLTVVCLLLERPLVAALSAVVSFLAVQGWRCVARVRAVFADGLSVERRGGVFQLSGRDIYSVRRLVEPNVWKRFCLVIKARRSAGFSPRIFIVFNEHNGELPLLFERLGIPVKGPYEWGTG